MGGYQDFLARKASGIQQAGRPITPDDMNARLHDWQKQIVAPAVFGAPVWLCGCGHRAWTEDQHTTHTQGDPA